MSQMQLTQPAQALVPETRQDKNLTTVSHTSTQNTKHNSAVYSIDTQHTITKVRVAHIKKQTHIIASTYEGRILAITYEGKILWESKLSGYMNHDLWCGDIDQDGIDEIFAANADGTIYAINSNGQTLWSFRQNEAPMYAVCTIKTDQDRTYIVCGGYDTKIYYLDPKGQLVKKLDTENFGIDKPWGKTVKPEDNRFVANFLRPMSKSNGTQILMIQGSINSIQSKGSIYLFHPLADTPYLSQKNQAGAPIGDVKIVDINQDGTDELISGTSTNIKDATFTQFDISSKIQHKIQLNTIQNQIDRFGYRVAQTEVIPDQNTYKYFILFGSRICLLPPSRNLTQIEIIDNPYSYNDMWRDKTNNKIILASTQSGGTSIHIIDPTKNHWKTQFKNITPLGNISAIRRNTDHYRQALKTFVKPHYERDPLAIYLTEQTQSTPATKKVAQNIKNKYSSPVFLNYVWKKHAQAPQDWNRNELENQKYRSQRDKRKKYDYTQQQILDLILPQYEGHPGIATWGGHGNDPYYHSLQTLKEIIDASGNKKTLLIWPELEKHDQDFEWVLQDLFYPLAQYIQETKKDANIYIRTKHTFWQSIAHMELWDQMLSGQYHDIFIPGMEETTDKSMELSIASRMGYWLSGAVDSWGARCARDNTSFDRLRQHSHQMLPNHFLRQMIYSLASGATYTNNFSVDQDYMSFYWELIAKGALYIPKRNELLSLSPVFIGITQPNQRYLDQGNNVKWITFYDQETEAANPMVFSRLNGTWPGAPNTKWDFSTYAAGVKDRRLNYLPPYNHGMVLIAPVQQGIFAQQNPSRGKLEDHLHPLYKGKTIEYITDGYHYYSQDGSTKYPADKFYNTVQEDIKKAAKQLPITVTGEVAWVVAQSSPTHLRLTLIDSGYINPSDKHAKVNINTTLIKPKRIVDLVDNTQYHTSDPTTVTIDIPSGLFRFIDIELETPLLPYHNF